MSFYIADLHFGNKSALSFDNRLFENKEVRGKYRRCLIWQQSTLVI